MEENIIITIIPIFSLFLGFILGLTYGRLQVIEDCIKGQINEKIEQLKDKIKEIERAKCQK